MDTLWILCGYSVDTLWILFGYSVDTLWILCGHSVDTLWILCGYSVGENRIKVRGNEEESVCLVYQHKYTDLAQGILGNDHFTNTAYTSDTSTCPPYL